ncbi:MAG: sensor histidine kinase [Myxococcota bacterium]
MLTSLKSIHNHLILPHPSIQSPKDQITARFLASWSFYGAFITPVVYALWNHYNVDDLNLTFLWGTLSMSAIIYTTSRSKYWRAGFWFQCFALGLSPTIAIINLPDLHANYVTFVFATIFCAPFVQLKKVIAVALFYQCYATALWLTPIGATKPEILSPLMLLGVLQLMTVILKRYLETITQFDQDSQKAHELAHINHLMTLFDIVLVEQDGTIIQWSPNAPQLLNCNSSDFEVGFEKFVDANPQLSQSKDTLSLNKQHHYHIYIDQRTSQKIITLRDISHFKDKLIREDILFKNSALGLITKGLAHEINNPLMHMTLSLEQLEKNQNQTEGERHERHLTSIKKGLEHIHALTQDLRMLANGHKVKSTRIIDCIKSTINLCGPALKQHKINVIQHIEEDAIVMASPGKLGQLFLNIIQNAIYAMTECTAKTITIDCQTTANEIKLSFADTGTGISEANTQMLFTPHFSTRPPHKGSGMGLYVCQQIVQELGGKIEISNTDQGAKIEIRLPSAAVTRDPPTLPRHAGGQKINQKRNEKSVTAPLPSVNSEAL